ncbi:MAG: hypothetical protein ACO31I_03195 [Prochlorotrichaceae cyanobacterium]|jgi:cyanosortase A-associated protein
MRYRTKLSWTQTRIILLGTIVGIVAILVGLPKSWFTSFDPENFYPENLPLPSSNSLSWEFISGSPVNPNEEWIGYRYLYQIPGEDSATLTLSAEVFLPWSQPPAPIRNKQILALIAQGDRDATMPPNRIQYDAEIGYFGEFVYQNRAYLSACILPEGGTVFNSSQHQQSRNILIKNPQHILLWIIGLRDLRDWQCLWTNLSLPIQGVAIELPVEADQITPKDLAKITEETEKSFVVLRSFWSSWYSYWVTKSKAGE